MRDEGAAPSAACDLTTPGSSHHGPGPVAFADEDPAHAI